MAFGPQDANGFERLVLVLGMAFLAACILSFFISMSKRQRRSGAGAAAPAAGLVAPANEEETVSGHGRTGGKRVNVALAGRWMTAAGAVASLVSSLMEAAEGQTAFSRPVDFAFLAIMLVGAIVWAIGASNSRN